jgi:hypothetical protein
MQLRCVSTRIAYRTSILLSLYSIRGVGRNHGGEKSSPEFLEVFKTGDGSISARLSSLSLFIVEYTGRIDLQLHSQ